MTLMSKNEDSSKSETLQTHFQTNCKCTNRITNNNISTSCPPSSLLKVKRLSSEAILPKRQSKHAAGYDLYSAVDYEIPPLSKGSVSTLISIQLPLNTYGRIAPRSGLAWKHSIDTMAGVVDCDYTGEIKVLLFNLDRLNKFVIKKGDRIAQLIIEKIEMPEVIEVAELDESERGTNGFGSTGID